MQPNIRVTLFDEDGERFFGEGPCRLLHAIEQINCRVFSPKKIFSW